MQLSATGQSRVRGYLFVLERSLRTSLKPPQVSDAVREIESHILERVHEAEPIPNEREALERILEHLGSPLTVARAYSAEMSAEEAVVTGRLIAIGRTLLYLADAGVRSFLTVFVLFVGYSFGLATILLAPLKLIAPNNVGIFLVDGVPVGAGANFPVREGVQVVGGFWFAPLALLIGIALVLVTHRAARRFVRRWLERRRANGHIQARPNRSQ